VVRRSADAPTITQRELAEAWEVAVQECGLPVAWTDAATPRLRLSFAAPLPLGVVGEAELIDVFLTERLPTWRVREALEGRLPTGWALVDLYDVWPAGPPLAGRVVAAEYRMELAAASGDATTIAAAAARMMSAGQLPRERLKSGGTVRYDLRPLVDEIAVVESGPPVVVRVRTRFDPELGTGRPDEVLAALAEAAGAPLEAVAIIRERLILADDLSR
jgi:radical SAM-linked protein